jgi:acetolactate synthase-1/2/3 large subunit
MAENSESKKEATGPVISGGHLVAKALKNEGVEVIWTLCGGHIIDIYDGCIDEGIKIIDVRHEQVAAHAADGYSRQSGKIGCVVTTAGPGTTNAMTGIANAFRAESPLLMIGGQGALSQHKMGSLQDLPHVDFMSPITKFAASVPHTERIADMVTMAFRESVNGAPGPSYLEIPRDVLDAKVPLERARVPKPGAYRASTKSIGDPADIERLADILVKSERPAALFGTQVWTSRGHDAAVEFCRTLNIPGYMNGSARGIFAPGDPHGFNRTRRLAFDKADVILVGKNRDISLGLVGDCGAILGAVAQAASGRASNGNAKRAEWMKELRAAEAKAYEKLLPSFKSESTPINPYRVAYEINEFLTDNTVYIGDGGDVVTITATAVEPRKAGNWMDPGPLGTLGVGTSFAMATKFVHPKKEVLCYYGDGSFGMTSWDMETAQRFGLPYIAVIGNNSAMNQIRCGQIGKYGPERGCVGNKLGDVDFEKFAECFGGWGVAVREPSQIRPALEKARERVAGGQCAIVNIWVDINEYAPGTKAQTMYK